MFNNREVGEIKIISKYCDSITRYNRMAGNFFHNAGIFPYPGCLRKKNIPDFLKAHFITLKNGVRGVLKTPWKEKSGVFLIKTLRRFKSFVVFQNLR